MPSALSDPDLLARLIAFDSTSCNSNRPIADALYEYLDRPGVRITRIPMPDGEKLNIVFETGPPSRDGGGLILSGHLDVVPAQEPDWQSNPFELREREGNWYGRGVCDMKAFVAMAANLMREVDPKSLRQPLVLMLTADEEVGSRGAQFLGKMWPKEHALPRSALVGEPTSLRAVRMHKGHLTLRIEVKGRPAHSGSPHLGRNAIEAAIPVLQSLNELRTQLASGRLPTSQYFETVPFAVLNIARIRGGNALNVVPDECVIELGVRLLPGQETSGVLQSITSLVERAGGGTASPPHLSVLNDNPPMLTPEDAPLHRALCELLNQRDSYGVSYASDAGPLRQSMGMDCVLFGGGNIEVAHRANEHIPIEEFRKAKETVVRLIQKFCLS